MQDSWYDSIRSASGQAWTEIMLFLPKLLLAVAIVIIGAAVARVVRSFVTSILEKLRVSKAVENTPVEHFLQNAELTEKIEHILGSIVYWILMLVVFHTAVSVVGLTSLSDLFEQVLSYIPHVFASVIILFIGILLSGLVESVIKGSLKSIDGHSARLLGKISSYIVLGLTIMVAISELGIASQYILILFIGFVTCLSVGIGLAAGLGGQHLVRQLLESWYSEFKKQTKE